MLTLIDAVNGPATLRIFGESARQVALADRLAIAKSDLLDEAERPARLAALRHGLRALNPFAPVAEIAAGEFRAVDLIALDADGVPGGMRVEAPSSGRHSASVSAYSLRLADAVGAPAFASFLRLLRAALGPRLLRIKGLVALAEHPTEPLVIQGVQHVFHPPRRLKAWPDEDRSTRIVLVADGLDRPSVDRLWAALAGAPRIDAPDLAALVESPLTPASGGLLA